MRVSDFDEAQKKRVPNKLPEAPQPEVLVVCGEAFSGMGFCVPGFEIAKKIK